MLGGRRPRPIEPDQASTDGLRQPRVAHPDPCQSPDVGADHDVDQKPGLLEAEVDVPPLEHEPPRSRQRMVGVIVAPCAAALKEAVSVCAALGDATTLERALASMTTAAVAAPIVRGRGSHRPPCGCDEAKAKMR